MTGNTWCDNKDGKSWNVKMAEKDIESVKRFAIFYRKKNMQDFVEDKILDLIFKDPEMNQAVKEAAREMADVMMGRDNPTGCHINHGVSGDSVYSLFSNDVASYKHLAAYDTKDEALAAKAELHDDDAALAIVEKSGDSFILMTLDQEETDRLREMKCYGTFVGDFSTIEDAENELEGLEDGYIVEMPANEWWMVVDNKLERSLFDMMFPTEVRAIAFLYKYKMPPAWKKLMELKQTRVHKEVND